ncbi:IS3 family transposase [Nakamurella leprariae]|uniref:IS3 family transposase n=1 Tax=Nakamurella leprariae TaxID=2803911 RepID=A0A938YJV5_9ACTN|nr:IS3 family transposase [Nakamurella leprariae]MBM9469627.1 IS3 family transposase [Nakamurella leprariae]
MCLRRPVAVTETFGHGFRTVLTGRVGRVAPAVRNRAVADSSTDARRAAPVSAATLRQAYLVNALIDLWRVNWGVYGARKLWHAARRAGLDVGRDQVGRLMAIGGISGAVRGRHRTRTTERDDRAARHPDLVQRGWDRPTGPDQLWVADFSSVWTLTGLVYVAFVVDVHSRRILGWRVAASKHTSMVTDALRQALDVRHRAEVVWSATGLTHHSDAGSQYTSVAYTAELIESGITGSIGTVGDALDNALCESTIGLFKTEAINQGRGTWTDRRAVEWQVARWVHWYNTMRLHSSIGHLPPIEFEHRHRQATTTTPSPAVA